MTFMPMVVGIVSHLTVGVETVQGFIDCSLMVARLAASVIGVVALATSGARRATAPNRRVRRAISASRSTKRSSDALPLPRSLRLVHGRALLPSGQRHRPRLQIIRI